MDSAGFEYWTSVCENGDVSSAQIILSYVTAIFITHILSNGSFPCVKDRKLFKNN